MRRLHFFFFFAFLYVRSSLRLSHFHRMSVALCVHYIQMKLLNEIDGYVCKLPRSYKGEFSHRYTSLHLHLIRHRFY